uniref:Peptidase A2 domain-containing protein n=1 Tax=Strongyloides venezuelensis TaxID=75913 RepID=A0A0K0FPR7_STRVS
MTHYFCLPDISKDYHYSLLISVFKNAGEKFFSGVISISSNNQTMKRSVSQCQTKSEFCTTNIDQSKITSQKKLSRISELKDGSEICPIKNSPNEEATRQFITGLYGQLQQVRLGLLFEMSTTDSIQSRGGPVEAAVGNSQGTDQKFTIVPQEHGKISSYWCLSPEAYRKVSISAAPRRPIELSLKELQEILVKIYEPERNNLVERLKALEICQEQSEPIHRYVDRLKDTIAQCYLDNVQDAKDLITIMIFTRGLKNDEMKKAVLQQHRIKSISTFNENVNAATGIEVIKRIDVESVNVIKQKRYNKHKNNKTMRCSYCNRVGHVWKDCKYKDRKCNNCNKVGHLKYVCKSKNKIVGAINEDSTSNGVSESTSVKDSGDIFTVFDKDMKNGKISVKLNSITKKILLDTGACRSLTSETKWRSIGAQRLEKKGQVLRDFNGNKLDLTGESEIEFVYKKSKVMAKVYVVRSDKQDLIGRDEIKRLKIDLNSVFFGKENEILSVETEDDVRSKIKLMYPNLFAEELGTYTSELIKIKLREDDVPKVIIYRCNNLNLKNKIRNEIERLIKLDVWKPINSSEWISPMLVALKTNGNVSICANFSQTINKVDDNEQYQIPTPHELFSRIEGCVLFSNFNISDAFLSIMIDPQYRKYLVVSTPIGLM